MAGIAQATPSDWSVDTSAGGVVIRMCGVAVVIISRAGMRADSYGEIIPHAVMDRAWVVWFRIKDGLGG